MQIKFNFAQDLICIKITGYQQRERQERSCSPRAELRERKTASFHLQKWKSQIAGFLLKSVLRAAFGGGPIVKVSSQ